MNSNKKTYKCPYCKERGTKEELVDHVENTHSDIIPKKYTSARVVFNYINKKEHGTCIYCKKPTEWNEDTHKYNRLCSSDKCRKGYSELFKKNMIGVYNKPTLLNDEDHQTKMLANRSISGDYIFNDGKKLSYTGSYEKKLLEFMDKVLNIPSTDIQTPGPVFEYKYENTVHKWITDVYYIPYNIVIEVKDGGSNPNNRQMVSYRDKQIAKEQMITKMGTFNYLRLTDNNFVQLMEIFAELKMQMIDDSGDNAIVKINEYTPVAAMSVPVGMNPNTISSSSSRGYVIPYSSRVSDEIEGFALANDILSDRIIVSNGENFISENADEFLEDRKFEVYKYLGESSTLEKFIREFSTLDPASLNVYEYLTENTMMIKDQIRFDSRFSIVNFDKMLENRNALSEGALFNSIRNKLRKFGKSKSTRSKEKEETKYSSSKELIRDLEKVRDVLLWKYISED